MNTEDETTAAEIRRQKCEERRMRAAQTVESLQKQRETVLRARAPFIAALVVLLVIIAVGLPFLAPGFAGGGMFLPWFLAALVLIFIIVARLIMKRRGN